MSDEVWVARYTQLNERSRWYTSQLWYVSFAYVALVGLGLEKVLPLQGPLRGLAFSVLALLSFATFVHVLSVKYLERRAVREMQKLEGKSNGVASRGGSKWFLSFASYLRLIPLIASFAFTWMVTAPDIVGRSLRTPLRCLTLSALLVLTGFVWWFDRQRNAEVIAEIRTATAIKANDGTGAA